MTRLKFLVFALIALGLWVAHLFILSPLIAARANDAATGQVAGAASAVALKLETQRSYLQGALLKAATSGAAVAKAGKVDPPSADRVNAARAAVQELVPEALREDLIVGIVNDSGALYAVGTKDPSAPSDGFDNKAAAAAGGKGEILDWGGPTMFHSVPITQANGIDVKQAGAIVAGLPLAAQGARLTDEVAKDLGLAGVGIAVDNKLTASSTGSKAALNDALKALKAGATGPLDTGTVLNLGPLKLPMFVNNPALDIGARRDIAGTSYEVIAIASTKPMIEALAGYQKTAWMMFGGLLLAALGFTVLMGSGGASDEDDEDDVQPMKKQLQAPPPPIRSSKQEPLPALLNEDAPPPEAHPDDFNFGPASTSSNGATSNERDSASTSELGLAPPVSTGENATQQNSLDEEDPFAKLMSGNSNSGAATVPAGKMKVIEPPPQKAPPPVGEFDDARTAAYPQHRPPADPFAQASAGQGFGAAIGDDNPDATRVAAIPAELLKASARTTSGETTAVGGPKLSAPLPTVKPIAPAIPAAGGGSEEAHFMEVFKDFVATRDRCGEPADGLTFEKFSAKLRKNKEQLVQKYNCRTVRFQVYVKDGKAALKATPVKD